MHLRRALYAWHRWIGLVVALQLLAWSVGGFVFSLLQVDDVHGDRERRASDEAPIVAADVPIGVGEALEKARAGSLGAVERVELRRRVGRLAWVLFGAKGKALATVDASTGVLETRLTVDEAKAAAVADFAPSAAVRSIDLFTEDAPLELRGKPLPAYRVIFDHPKEPHIYVSAVTGEVIARRNGRWRFFDFFYMLHVMDYRERESFNHWLLTLASALAVVSAATGLALHGARLFRKRARTAT